MNQPLDPTATDLPAPTLRNWDRADLLGRVESLRGRRLILVNSTGSHHDYRAWGEIRASAGAIVLDAVSEEDWWRYRHLAMRPRRVLRWPAAACWVEAV